MRSFKQTNNKPNVYVWIGGVGSEVGRINFICGFDVNTSKNFTNICGKKQNVSNQEDSSLDRQGSKKNKDRGVRISARAKRRSSSLAAGVRAWGR